MGKTGGKKQEKLCRAWKKISVDDQFLQGLEEPGFQELEVVAPGDIALLDSGLQKLIAKADQDAQSNRCPTNHEVSDRQAGSKARPSDAKAKRKEKKPKQHSTNTDEVEPSNGEAASNKIGQSEEDLKARILELELENAKLRTAAVQPVAEKASGAINGATCGHAAQTQSTAEGVENEEILDMSAWEGYGLDPLVVKALAAKRFTSPTPIQHECLPAAVLGGSEIIGAAQTGSGKTLAFGLPIINYLVQERERRAGHKDDEVALSQCLPGNSQKLRALILCPTRELAMQVCAHLTDIAKPLAIRVVPIVGGVSAQKHDRLLGYKPPIVVATPGRLWDVMRQGHAHLSDLTYLSFLVLDEADRMVKHGHYEELTHILDRIPAPGSSKQAHAGDALDSSPAAADPETDTTDGTLEDMLKATLAGPLRTYVFSATLTLPSKLKQRLQRGCGGSRGSGAGASFDNLMSRMRFHGKPKIADLTSKRRLADNLTDSAILCEEKERMCMLVFLLAAYSGRTLVFLNAISSIRRVGALLKLLGISAQVLHAQQQQRQRFKALDRFKADENAVLLATDVAARGLDIPGVRCVVQYQLPPTADTYIHRAGRTARAQGDGLNIALVVPAEAVRYRQLHVVLGRDQPPVFPVDWSLVGRIQARVSLAERIDELERSQRRTSADLNWMAKRARDAELDFDPEEVVPHKQGKHRGVSDKSVAASLRRELASLLAEPLRQGLSKRYVTGGMSREVAAAVSACAGGNDGAAGRSDGPGNVGLDWQGAAGALQKSLKAAEEIVASRGGAPELESVGAKKRKGVSLAECQAQALRRALEDKRRRKADRGATAKAAGAETLRKLGGADALGAVRAL